MSAFAMVARCAEAQWRGLQPEERELLLSTKRPTYAPNSGFEHRVPIWTVVHTCSAMILMGVKDDA